MIRERGQEEQGRLIGILSHPGSVAREGGAAGRYDEPTGARAPAFDLSNVQRGNGDFAGGGEGVDGLKQPCLFPGFDFTGITGS
jgi:hypothetical protein